MWWRYLTWQCKTQNPSLHPVVSQSEIFESPLTMSPRKSSLASFRTSPWECLLTHWAGGGVLLTSSRTQRGQCNLPRITGTVAWLWPGFTHFPSPCLPPKCCPRTDSCSALHGPRTSTDTCWLRIQQTTSPISFHPQGSYISEDLLPHPDREPWWLSQSALEELSNFVSAVRYQSLSPFPLRRPLGSLCKWEHLLPGRIRTKKHWERSRGSATENRLSSPQATGA